jgi:starch phosphorylase
MRLVQEVALGIGGWRALEALGLAVDVCHLNEGHAAMVAIERARSYADQHDLDFREALWATRAGNVFTTHTPVAAAFDTYPPALVAKYSSPYAERLDIPTDDLLRLVRADPHDGNEPVNLAYLAARTCYCINGVSRLHGEVSRRIFQPLYPLWPEDEVPVTHITNGVHVPSWDSAAADELWTETCGKARWLGTLETHPEALRWLDDAALWNLRMRERVLLIEYARKHLARQFGQRGAEHAAVEQAMNVLDPNALTLGFARRFAAYKRPDLLLTDPGRLVRLLTNPQRPVQLIVAGKAHPEDGEGKAFVRAWVKFVSRDDVRVHAIFLEDYDISLAQELVQGVDLWINTPRRPWEASGTSGMKVLANGGLNLSELDGWWAEAYRPETGWALGDGYEHSEPEWDIAEATELYRLLEQEVVPLFYERDPTGIPRRWVARMRASMSELAPHFSSNRMVREYVEQIYRPAIEVYRARVAGNAELARTINAWAERLQRHWDRIHIGVTEAHEEGGHWRVRVPVYLGDLSPSDVQVELYAECAGDAASVCVGLERGEALSGAKHGFLYHGLAPADRPIGHYTARVVPAYPGVRVPAELPLIVWQK